MLDNGSVTWEDQEKGGATHDKKKKDILNDHDNKVVKIYSTESAFAAVLDNKSVVTCGKGDEGGQIPEVLQEKLKIRIGWIPSILMTRHSSPS